MSACSSLTGAAPGRIAGQPAAPGDAAWAQELCDTIPGPWLQRMVNSYRSDWSGDVQFLPEYPNPVDGGLSHTGPWEHLQNVPLLFYGPGFVRAGTHHRSAGLVDVAPTTARVLDFGFTAPDGRVLEEALLPSDERAVPRLVVTLVWDAGGMDVLNEWPDDWPYLRSLIPRGAWFDNAMVDIANSNTPPGHSAIGTGALPPTTGFIDTFLEFGGQLGNPSVPRLLLWPTLGDLFDTAHGNRPVVGTVGTLPAHTMMMSHGTQWNGGDRDLTMIRQTVETEAGAKSVVWTINDPLVPYYAFPAYVNDVASIDPHVRELDQRDGRLDGNWRTDPIARLRSGFDTPARIPYQTELVEEVIRREGFGDDRVPDLLYVNYKAIDSVGHGFGLTTVEMKDTVRYQDRALRQLISFLDREVGREQWVLILTADHGAQYPAEVTGGIPIDPNKVRALVAERFGTALIPQVRPTQLWIDAEELGSRDVTVEDVARFIGGLTARQVARSDFEPTPDQADRRVYQAAFPSRLFDQLPCISGPGPT